MYYRLSDLRVLLLLAFVAVLSACGGGGGGNSTSSSSQTPANDIEGPQFDGFALVVAGDTDKASIAWMPATDNVSAADDIQYKLYFDTNPSFIPSATNLENTYMGETSTLVTGLTAGTNYFFKIVAIDEAGNQTQAADSAAVTTATTPVVQTTTPVKEAEALDLGAAQIDTTDNSIYHFSINPNSVAPQVGDVLIGEDVNGNGYLRLVDTVTQDAATFTVGTSNASLSDILETASISSEVVLRATDQDPILSTTSLPRSMRLSQKNSTSQSLEWEDKLLTVTESGFARSKQKMSSPSPATVVDVSADQALTLTGTITFEPKVTTNVTLDTLTISSATAEVSGDLDMDLTLAYNYTGSASVSDSKQIFKRTYSSLYHVGLIPVWQETTLTLTAQFTGQASTAIQAQTNASLSSNVTINAHYDGSTWTASSSESFNKDLTVSAEAHGSATAEVRLVPEVEVRFYSVASTTVSVEPYTNATVAAEAVTEASLVENNYMEAYGFTQFDAFMGVDVNLVADLTVFSFNVARYPESGVASLYHNEAQLFGLPSIDQATVQGIPNIYGSNLNMSATVTPFTSTFDLVNGFDESTAQWVIFPSNETITGRTGAWVPPSHGSVYRVYFVGNSEMLGPIGRQYREATFVFPESATPTELDMRDDDGDGMPNIWESYYGLNLSVNDANVDSDGDGTSNIEEYIAATDPVELSLCTQRGFLAEGVSTKTDANGIEWTANCVNNLLTDYADSTPEDPHYALSRLYGDSYVGAGEIAAEYSYTNGENNLREIHYSYDRTGAWVTYLSTVIQYSSMVLSDGSYQLVNDGFLRVYSENAELINEIFYAPRLQPDGLYYALREGIQKTRYYSQPNQWHWEERPYTIVQHPNGAFESFLDGFFKQYYPATPEFPDGVLLSEQPHTIKTLPDGGFQSVTEGVRRNYNGNGYNHLLTGEYPYSAYLQPDGRYQGGLTEGISREWSGITGELTQIYTHAVKQYPDGTYTSVVEGLHRRYPLDGSGIPQYQRYYTAVLQPHQQYESLRDGVETHYGGSSTDPEAPSSETTFVIKVKPDGYHQEVVEGLHTVYYFDIGLPQSQTNYLGVLQPDGSYSSMRHGEERFYYPSGNLQSLSNYTEGLLNGLVVGYYDSAANQISDSWEYIDGVLNGEGRVYWQTGQLNESWQYTDGILNGAYRYYNETGQLLTSGQYLNGSENGTWTGYFADGVRSSVTTYNEGILDGPWQRYYASGGIRVDGQYTNGTPTGTWTYYNEDGTVRDTVNY